MFIVLSCPIHWSQMLIWERRCRWNSANKRCSNYISVINNYIAYKGAPYICVLRYISLSMPKTYLVVEYTGWQWISVAFKNLLVALAGLEGLWGINNFRYCMMLITILLYRIVLFARLCTYPNRCQYYELSTMATYHHSRIPYTKSFPSLNCCQFSTCLVVILRVCTILSYLAFPWLEDTDVLLMIYSNF